MTMRIVALVAVLLMAGNSVSAAEEPWRFVSMPDFLKD